MNKKGQALKKLLIVVIPAAFLAIILIYIIYTKVGSPLGATADAFKSCSDLQES